MARNDDVVFVVTDNCIKCKYTACVEVCPIDCFYEGKNMLVINPEECTGCGVCEVECPNNAITAEDRSPRSKWQEFNRTYAAKWPVISSQKAPLPEANEFKGVPDKLRYFSENPGSGS